MEKVIRILREHHFVFASYETLKAWVETDEWGAQSLSVKPIHESYSFMVQELRPGTISQRGRYNTAFLVAIKMVGPKTNNIHIYYKGEYETTYKKPWKDKADINFRRVKITLKFPPEFEDHAERRKWRTEHKKLEKDPSRKPSAFYDKWKDKVQILTK